MYVGHGINDKTIPIAEDWLFLQSPNDTQAIRSPHGQDIVSVERERRLFRDRRIRTDAGTGEFTARLAPQLNGKTK